MAAERDPDRSAQRVKPARAHVDEATTIAHAQQLIETMEKAADAFEQTAALAELEAERRAAAGRDDAEPERRAAAAAHEAAQRARAHAAKWREYLRAKGTPER